MDKLTLWEQRDQVTTQAEAVAALADFFSSSHGIVLSLGENPLRRFESTGSLDDAEDFARKWDIPFNRDLHVQMVKLMDAKRWASDEDYDMVGHHWVSSSEDC